MNELLILAGVSGSGKSTYARSLERVVVSRDDIRKSLFGSDDQDYYAKPRLGDREELVTQVEYAMIESALKANFDVVSDSTNLIPEYVLRMVHLGWDLEAKVKVKVMYTSVDTALYNIAKRAATGGRTVPKHVVRNQYNRLQKLKEFLDTTDLLC